MDKLSTAAALSGWSQNKAVARTERDIAAEGAFQIYEGVTDGIRELLADCERWSAGGSGSASGAYALVAQRLKTLLDPQ